MAVMLDRAESLLVNESLAIVLSLFKLASDENVSSLAEKPVTDNV